MASAGRAPTGGNYALAVQNKSHFGSGNTNIGALAHEIAHQWFGDSVGPATWREIWFNEGWATWWAPWWSNKQNNNSQTMAAFFNAVYNSTNWSTAPANLGSAENLFDTMPVYNRPAATLGAFQPGVGAAYDASTTATVVSSAGDAALSVADPATANTGKLVNGAFALAQPVQARANAGAFAPVGGSANPTTLFTYSAPISNDAVTLGFRQTIGANEALRTGTYSKTLTFTLSTTTP
jgi:hypothetical protein